jgi:tetratricopeptide (TPR) repeat protein
MPEPRRAQISSSAKRTVSRASQADTLLVQGLDRYFAGQLDDAIHIWTRVLFLDRSHARARAYIDRARSALAERQRQSDEMLQTSQQLLDRGQTDAARRLLAEAVASNGDDERAADVRVRLERLERAHADPRPPALAISAAPDVVPAWTWPKRATNFNAVLAAIAAAVLLFALAGGGLRLWADASPDTERVALPVPAVRMQVLSSSEVALVRARTLYGRGRLAQALQALDRVDDRSTARAEADALRVEIQRLLLASAPGVLPTAVKVAR